MTMQIHKENESRVANGSLCPMNLVGKSFHIGIFLKGQIYPRKTYPFPHNISYEAILIVPFLISY